MAKIKVKDSSGTDPSQVVSPTQAQMDDWYAEELAEADETQMLANEVSTTIFDSDPID